MRNQCNNVEKIPENTGFCYTKFCKYKFLSTEPHSGDDGMFDDYRLYFKNKKGENISRLSCKLKKKISYPFFLNVLLNRVKS